MGKLSAAGKTMEQYFLPRAGKPVSDLVNHAVQNMIIVQSVMANIFITMLVIRLLMLTDCRLGEIMTLKWSYVDLR